MGFPKAAALQELLQYGSKPGVAVLLGTDCSSLLSFPIMFFLLALFSHLFFHSRLVYLICLGVVAVQLSHLIECICCRSFPLPIKLFLF
uniref:Uncharacterized protein n=1 Tax=Anser brachyrhynchus TaxID=132585 RepID=A0A8B9C8P4_9AVES